MGGRKILVSVACKHCFEYLILVCQVGEKTVVFVNKMLAFFHLLITHPLLAHFSHPLALTESLGQANIFLHIKFLNFFLLRKIQKIEYGVLSIGSATEWREVWSGSSML